MKHKRDIETILIINAIFFIFFEPAIMVGRYMTRMLFKTIKNLFFKKNLSLKKETLSFENIWVFFSNKPWVLKKIWVSKKTMSFEKIWVLKNVLKKKLGL